MIVLNKSTVFPDAWCLCRSNSYVHRYWCPLALSSCSSSSTLPFPGAPAHPAGFWEAASPSYSSPLLVLVNSKSGDNQGVKFLRRFKQLLNPAQVFDLMIGGPQLG